MRTRRMTSTEMNSVEIGLLAFDADDAVAADVTHLVNRVYATAEERLWGPDTDRTRLAEVTEFIRLGELAVARLNGRIVGAVRIQRLDNEVGEFGMLAASPDHRGIGIGRRLVDFAERLTTDRGLRTMRLELLVPQTWTHPTKRFLHDWYTRLGYRVVRKGSIEELIPQPGVAAGDAVRLRHLPQAPWLIPGRPLRPTKKL
jgi:GNAT superfamily N-acetyltransferase